MFYQSPTHNYFNKTWYKRTYNLNIADDELLNHYCNIGYKENLNPSLYFNTKWYKERYNIPDNVNPLEHFTENLKRHTLCPNEKCKYFIRNLPDNVDWTIMPNHDFIPFADEKKRINLLLPAVGFSAGPATIYLFANYLIKHNYNVRIIFLFSDVSTQDISSMTNIYNLDPKIELVSLLNDEIVISYNDIFIASAWWTVYPLKFILGFLNVDKFFWFIQENELVLHAADETYAKALSCYNMEYYSFINTSVLFDDLKQILYPFTQEKYCNENVICVEPAFNTDQLFYIEKPIRNSIQFIFYSRDKNMAKRNCVKLVHDLLESAYQSGIITLNDKIYGFGQTKGTFTINNVDYEDLGFLESDEYYKLLRESDILISFQLAPHPSYPPLEMSFCNGLTLHTNFSNKTNESMLRYTDKIIMCNPDIHSLLDGLTQAVIKVKQNKISRELPKLLNNNWEIPFEKILTFIQTKIL